MPSQALSLGVGVALAEGKPPCSSPCPECQRPNVLPRLPVTHATEEAGGAGVEACQGTAALHKRIKPAGWGSRHGLPSCDAPEDTCLADVRGGEGTSSRACQLLPMRASVPHRAPLPSRRSSPEAALSYALLQPPPLPPAPHLTPRCPRRAATTAPGPATCSRSCHESPGEERMERSGDWISQLRCASQKVALGEG